MAQNITLLGASYTDVPAVELPKTGGGTATFTDTTPTTASASDVSQGKYFFTASGVLTLGTNQGGSGDGYVWQDAQGYIHLSDEQGTQTIIDSLTITQGGTYTAPTGHAYSPVTVASGTAGTPTATKGSVSNHSISVTPSVTNTSGYITGSTINGTAVSVSASELVSGTLTVDSSGTKNVTNYASASIPSGASNTPTINISSVSNHSVSISASATSSTGWITGATRTSSSEIISASDLVSGSQTLTVNDTYDVTNLAEVVVNVAGSTATGVAYLYTDLSDMSQSFDVSDYATASVDFSPLDDGKTRIWVDIDTSVLSTITFTLKGASQISNALTIKYGDGTTETISSTNSDSPSISHEYTTSGRYCIEITSNTSTVFYLYNNAFGSSASDNSRCVVGIESVQTQSTCYPFARYCPNLKAVSIFGDATTTINGYFFNQSPSVERIVIPKNVASIGASAFSYCTNLKKVVIKATTPPTIQSSTFPSTVPSDLKIYVPSASLSTYQSTANWSTYASYMVGE